MIHRHVSALRLSGFIIYFICKCGRKNFLILLSAYGNQNGGSLVSLLMLLKFDTVGIALLEYLLI